MQKSTVTKLKQALIATGNLKDYGTSTVTLALSGIGSSTSGPSAILSLRFFQASLDSSCTTISQNPSSELGSIRSSSINTEVTKRNF